MSDDELEGIIQRAAIRMRRKYAIHQDRSIQEDLRQSAWEWVIRHPESRTSQYLKQDIHHAMLDEITHWLWGCKRGQKARRIKEQVEMPILVTDSLRAVDRLVMVWECYDRLLHERPPGGHGRPPNVKAMVALLESGSCAVPGYIMEKYRVTSMSLHKARVRGRKIYYETVPSVVSRLIPRNGR